MTNAPRQTSALVRRGAWRVARVLVGALVLAWAFRACVAEPFRIPSESMAATLLPGDYVLVSKLGYGGPLSWADPGRGDVIAFGYPLEPDDAPVYVKRVAGLPGDTIALLAKQLRVDGDPVSLPSQGRIRWRVTSRGGETLPLGSPVLRRLAPVVLADTIALVHATTREIDAVRRLSPHPEAAPDLAARGGVGPSTFPAGYGFSRDFYGPIRVPAEGDTVRLTRRAWPLYQTLIRQHEGRSVEPTPTGFAENGLPIDYVVLKGDYYFVLGDSRDDSQDSRAWGFVPRDHVEGRAVAIYFSSDAEGARWNRIGRLVK